MIDTGKLSPEFAIQMIMEAARNLGTGHNALLREPTTNTIHVAPALRQIVKDIVDTLPSEYSVDGEQIEFAYA